MTLVQLSRMKLAQQWLLKIQTTENRVFVLQNVLHCWKSFPYFSRFLLPWQSRLPLSLLLPLTDFLPP